MSRKSSQKAFKEAHPQVDIGALEKEILKFWESEHIFEKSIEQNRDKHQFTFYDGPPYATGKPHYGQILQSALKDTVLRYKTMRGYYVPRRVGWDTHGLPIENIVEKELGISSKREIEKDIEGFNRKCRDTVYRYVDAFTAMLKRIGRWADYDNAYSTLDRDYMESEWWVFKQLWEQGLVYKAFRSTSYCIRCATPLSNFEVSMGYKQKTDTAVYVALEVRPERAKRVEGDTRIALRPIRHAQGHSEVLEEQQAQGQTSKNLFLLVWTTTPWTLPGNTAVAISPSLTYVTAKADNKLFILAEERVKDTLGPNAKIVDSWDTADLLKMRYEPLYESDFGGQDTSKAFSVVESDIVSADEGTGVVHMAPAFGEEDHEIGKRYGLPILRTVSTLGTFAGTVQKFAGKNIFSANNEIVADLKERGLLVKEEQYTHSYPFCWRCDTPLIDYAIDSWFVKISELKDEMLTSNESINWIPKHVKHGRFKKGIESAPDWAVSRNRFWSVPMPVWECDRCTHRICIGSIQELKNLSGAQEEAVKDIHRPYVDEIMWDCERCKKSSEYKEALLRPARGGGYGGRPVKGKMIRVAEVLDVWFDSGSMPYSQWHYPFENTDIVTKGFPADFIVEAIEQTRAWFYTLHVLATALTRADVGLGKNLPAYRNVIASGIIFAEDGNKLSKKLKNYPEPEPTIEKYGADTIRFYFMNSTLGEPYQFSEKALQQLHRSFYLTLWNVYSFFVRYANIHHWQPHTMAPKSTNSMDRWILARTKQLEHDVIHHTDSYRLDYATRSFVEFIGDLSNWYVRRSRSRFQAHASEKEWDEAFSTLHEVLVRLSKVLAPFMPFVSEEIFKNIAHGTSVHVEYLAEPEDLTDVENTLLTEMAYVRTVVSLALGARAEAGIKVRQPLALLKMVGDLELVPEYIEIIKSEVNVDEVAQSGAKGGSEGTLPVVQLDTDITDELRQRGLAREVIRRGQVLRKKAGYLLNDRITFIAVTDGDDLQAALKSQYDVVKDALQADEIVERKQKEDVGEDDIIEGQAIHLGVVKKRNKD